MKNDKFLSNYRLPTYYLLPANVTVVLHDNLDRKALDQAEQSKNFSTKFEDLKPAENRLHHLRDREVVLYKISRSNFWQARFHLFSGQWIRFSTRKRNLDDAMRIACDKYDEARFRERQGLSPITKRFDEIAKVCILEMKNEITAGTAKSVFTAYIQVIEQYFIPFFGQMYLTNISNKEVIEFEIWRDQRMKKRARASTLLTFVSSFNRVLQTAISRGWISSNFAAPKFTGKGLKGEVRPAFSKDEIIYLRQHLTNWYKEVEGKSMEMRRLLRDYVDVLIFTGIRQGTESMNIFWKHIEWHWDKDVRYLRIWVSGKTGPRWLIAKHECVDVLKRLQQTQPDIANMNFDELIAAKMDIKLFRLSDGKQPYELTHVFTRLMKSTGLLKSSTGGNRTLYSLRHTYATFELLAGTDIHTLAKQMGTSVLMIEKHYSKMTATMAAAKLA